MYDREQRVPVIKFIIQCERCRESSVPDAPHQPVLHHDEQRKNRNGFPAQQQRLEGVRRFAHRRAPEEDSQDELQSQAQQNRRHGQRENFRPATPVAKGVVIIYGPVRVLKQVGDAVNRQQKVDDDKLRKLEGKHLEEKERQQQDDAALRPLECHADQQREQTEEQDRAQN